MIDKVQKIREEVEKIKTAHSSVSLKESNPDILVVQVCTNLLFFIDSLQEKPKTDWLQELQEKLDSLSKEDFKKVWAKYSRYGEEGSVDYNKLNTMLDESLSKETKESWNERLCEEPVSEELSDVAITAADEDMQGRQIMEESNENRQLYSRIFRRGFKAGAKWQKEQMIAKAIDGIARPDDNEIWCNLSTFNFKDEM